MTRQGDPSRRLVVGSGLLSAGGLAVGLGLREGVRPAAAQGSAAAVAPNELTAWVIVRPDETIVIRIPRVELGQGTLTGLAQLAAEELDCDWQRVTTEQPGPGQNLLRERIWGDQVTTGSRGLRGSQEALRKAGAAARLMLVQAAADLWRVPVTQLTVSKGIVSHTLTRRSISYGRLAPFAARLKAPDPRSIKLKDPKAWTIAGKPLRRLDTLDKLSGRVIYGIDLQLPDMLCAAIRDVPYFGEKLVSFEADAIKDRSGVRHVLKVGETAVAVVADTWWQAKTALSALPVTWSNATQTRASSATIAEHLKEGLETREAYVGTTHGDALRAIGGAAKKVEAVYSTPYLHQAPLEPITCSARWTPERVEVWVGTQNPEGALKAAAEAAGLPITAAEVNRVPVGGAFGRRGRQDYVTQAVLIARQVPGTPIKLIWSREEDMGNGFYRPATMAKLIGGIDEKGETSGLILRISGQSIVASQLAPGQKAGRDARMFQGLNAEVGEAQIGYSIANLYVDHAMRQTPVPVGSWRGVHANQNALFLECFIDEMAHAAGKSPLEFRRAMMRSHPRHLAVLTAAAVKVGWNRSEVETPHRGIAQLMSYGSYAAAVAEVSVRPGGKVRVNKVVVALDCGTVVNPDLIAAQVEGQVAFALGAMLHQEITIADGRAVEQNFDTYPSLTLAEMPVVETVLVPSGEFWGGVGEAVVAVVPPAVLNALFVATGKRVRTLPLKNVKF
ncbi:MAG: molybdopterin cofactor-binding domain-containing protein [Hyphomicrobiaceae bacterium]